MVAKKANTSAKIIASNIFISSPQFHFIFTDLIPYCSKFNDYVTYIILVHYYKLVILCIYGL